MNKRILMIAFLSVAVLTAFGCGKKADPNKPLDQVQAEADKMSAADLEATAQAYAKAIAEKKVEADKIQAEIGQLKVQELFSDKAKGIKDRAAKLGEEVSALTARYQIYASQFQAKGGDLSKIQIQ